MPAWLSDNLITIVDGVAFGVLLFTIAVGLSLVFGIMDVLNLAHGALYLVGAYLAVRFAGDGQAGIGAFLARRAGRGRGGRGRRGRAGRADPAAGRRGHLDQALLTLGVALIVGDLLSARFGNDVQSVPPPAFLAGSVSLAGHAYPSYRLAVIVAGLALAAARLAAGRAEPGRGAGPGDGRRRHDGPGHRASTPDGWWWPCSPSGWCWPACGGVLGAPVYGAYPGLDERVLILALVVVVLGGLGSVRGALLGALVIGQVEVAGGVAAAPVRQLPALRDAGPGPAAAAPRPARAGRGGPADARVSHRRPRRPRAPARAPAAARAGHGAGRRRGSCWCCWPGAAAGVVRTWPTC